MSNRSPRKVSAKLVAGGKIERAPLAEASRPWGNLSHAHSGGDRTAPNHLAQSQLQHGPDWRRSTRRMCAAAWGVAQDKGSGRAELLVRHVIVTWNPGSAGGN